MTNVVPHPAFRSAVDRIVRLNRDELAVQRDRAVAALKQAISHLDLIETGDRHTEMATIVGGLRTAMDALSGIDPLAPPDAALVRQLADTIHRLGVLAVDTCTRAAPPAN